MPKQDIAKVLTYAGTLPFLGVVLASLSGLDLMGFDPKHVILSYGAVIISFICGIHWGLYLYREAPLNLFIHSNVVTLIAWFALLLGLSKWQPFSNIAPWLLIGCFIYLLWVDRLLFRKDLHENWFMTLRTHATLIVSVALLFFAILR